MKIEFLEWYRQSGAVSFAANPGLAVLNTFAEYAQMECIEYISTLQEITTIKSKRTDAKDVSFLAVEQLSLLINRPDINTATGFRHSKAMHMLATEINIVYIQDFLGHEDISTTMVCARADNRLKDAAINKLAPKVVESEELPDWSKVSAGTYRTIHRKKAVLKSKPRENSSSLCWKNQISGIWIL